MKILRVDFCVEEHSGSGDSVNQSILLGGGMLWVRCKAESQGLVERMKEATLREDLQCCVWTGRHSVFRLRTSPFTIPMVIFHLGTCFLFYSEPHTWVRYGLSPDLGCISWGRVMKNLDGTHQEFQREVLGTR